MKKILLIIAIFVMGCPTPHENRIRFNDHGLDLTPLAPESSWRNPLGEPTYVVRVKGLVCPSCAVGLKKALMRLSFVRAIHVNYNTGITHIYEKRSRDKGGEALDKSRITKAIESGGYKVDKFKK
ncbi:hypothetical protein CMI37_28410 [Candidatus Pacearchaeota archaeon]|nr:hypothetical protein [Candidatus Pacearchaeota archaeon]|tara:strand:+ start:1778 stop:2152 length:375 start_codon:yes stop_codon:yes gene_type:complete